MSAYGDYQLKHKPMVIRIFGSSVTDFSSQYGAEVRMSYAAHNLAGKCSIYPNYGDFTQACVFRTYGPWWKMVPSAFKPYQKRPYPGHVPSEDFVEILFEESVYPVAVQIYETYNPGAIVRIMGCDADAGTNVDSGTERKWTTLWTGPVVKAPQRVRIFSPPIKKIGTKINMLRLELNHSLVDYYTELDAVMLCGVEKRPSTCQEYSDLQAQVMQQTPADHAVWTPDGQMDELACSCQCTETQKSGNTVCVCGIGVRKMVEALSSVKLEPEQEHLFEMLPGEVILMILAYLDIISLSRVAQTCKLLHKHVYDSVLYTELDLQPLWHLVSSQTLGGLAERCLRLQRLNLSWCGKDQRIDLTSFKMLAGSCSDTLTCLELRCCPFVNKEFLSAAADICPNLRELDVSGCPEVNNCSSIMLVKMSSLERLSLYRTKIDTHTAVCIVRSLPELRHLNLGSCSMIRNMGEVLEALTACCPKLISLDIWRPHSVEDSVFKKFIRACPLIEELDIGWCADLNSRNGSFSCIAENCRNLKKLYLTAIRSVCDEDLQSMAKYSTKLQQLDILGTRLVSGQVIERLLSCCKDMVMLDISFCANISEDDVQIWKVKYPNCQVKKSFQNNN